MIFYVTGVEGYDGAEDEVDDRAGEREGGTRERHTTVDNKQGLYATLVWVHMYIHVRTYPLLPFPSAPGTTNNPQNNVGKFSLGVYPLMQCTLSVQLYMYNCIALSEPICELVLC